MKAIFHDKELGRKKKQELNFTDDSLDMELMEQVNPHSINIFRLHLIQKSLSLIAGGQVFLRLMASYLILIIVVKKQ